MANFTLIVGHSLNHFDGTFFKLTKVARNTLVLVKICLNDFAIIFSEYIYNSILKVCSSEQNTGPKIKIKMWSLQSAYLRGENLLHCTLWETKEGREGGKEGGGNTRDAILQVASYGKFKMQLKLYEVLKKSYLKV